MIGAKIDIICTDEHPESTVHKWVDNKATGARIPYLVKHGWYVGATVENGKTRAIVQLCEGGLQVVDLQFVTLKV